MKYIWKTCKGIAGQKTKHVSLSFMDPLRQRLILDMGKLEKVARQDFPEVDRLAIIVEVGGNTQAPKQVGIGFDIPMNAVLPEGYSESIVYK